jgi:hypothetical protein
MSTAATSAVFRHSASKGSARLVLLAMADEANDQGLLTAYRRSQSWLGRKANVDSGTVRRAIAALVELGEVVVLATGDGRASSDYQLLLPGLADPDEGVQPAPPAPAGRAPSPGSLHPQGAQAAPPIIPLDPLPPGATPTPRASEAAALAAGFDRFWSAYPRATAKGDARKAWPAAVRAAGGIEAIVAGAERYRDDPNRDDRFTAHAATWLRAERWADPPLPPRGTGANPAKVRPIDTNREAAGGRLEL